MAPEIFLKVCQCCWSQSESNRPPFRHGWPVRNSMIQIVLFACSLITKTSLVNSRAGLFWQCLPASPDVKGPCDSGRWWYSSFQCSVDMLPAVNPGNQLLRSFKVFIQWEYWDIICSASWLSAISTTLASSKEQRDSGTWTAVHTIHFKSLSLYYVFRKNWQ